MPTGVLLGLTSGLPRALPAFAQRSDLQEARQTTGRPLRSADRI